jgi:hypothetical protein
MAKEKDSQSRGNQDLSSHTDQQKSEGGHLSGSKGKGTDHPIPDQYLTEKEENSPRNSSG